MFGRVAEESGFLNKPDFFLEKGIFISPEVLNDPILLNKLDQIDPASLADTVIIDKDFFSQKNMIKSEGSPFRIIFSYDKKPHKINVQDFVAYFNRRFEGLSLFLRQRSEFGRTVSINRLKSKADREKVSIIGLVFEKVITKNNNIILTIEDPSGSINVLIKPDKKELYAQAKDIVLDELIGIEGSISHEFIYANQIYFPDIPLIKELKKGPVDVNVVLFGDPHFGSKVFLKDEFEDFLEWINQRKGSPEQREIAGKVKYMIIVGDLVEGVGIYPDQEKDLAIMDIQEQYDLFASYLRKIPNHIRIFICPGNHDVGRISEPQQPLLHFFAANIAKLPNVTLISNPAIINIGAQDGFVGFDFLIYHGYSFIYYANNVESIRSKGGQKRADLIMKLLLQKRHMAPTHTSNLYIPDVKEDPLIIKDIPDFFITGHIHRVSVNNFRNVTMASCSCWTAITEDQEKRGLQPQPAKIPVINLKTREVKILNFLKEKKGMQEDQSAQGNENAGIF
jgi:DNA polymerase II small subunit